MSQMPSMDLKEGKKKMNRIYMPQSTTWGRVKGAVSEPGRIIQWRLRALFLPIFQARAKRRLAEVANLDFLRARPADAIPPDYCDLLFLFETVRRLKPKVLFEFGSGCSTAILAQAARLNHLEGGGEKPFLYSFEANEFWATKANELIGPEIRSYCEIRYAPAVDRRMEGPFIVLHHGQLPPVIPDFVYVDGPSGPEDEQSVATDVQRLEMNLRPGFAMIIDGRWKNVAYFKSQLKRPFKFHHRWFYNNSIATLS